MSACCAWASRRNWSGCCGMWSRLTTRSWPAHLAEGPAGAEPQLLAFYAELVERVARLAAEWMAAGFTHGVLNTDNMSLAAESFDYGPFAFLETWDPGFTAASFDHSGLYAYGRQPLTCHHNLRLLQEPLALLLPRAGLEARLERFAPAYDGHYRARLLRRLGFDQRALAATASADRADLVFPTLQLLARWPMAYGSFFAGLAARLEQGGVPAEAEALVPFVAGAPEPPRQAWLTWRDAWWIQAQALPADHQGRVAATAQRGNLVEAPVRPVVERIWEAIDQRDDWGPLHGWLAQVVSP